jgi:hypothetical protein
MGLVTVTLLKEAKNILFFQIRGIFMYLNAYHKGQFSHQTGQKIYLRLNIDKYQFFSEEWDLLGFRVSTKGVKPRAQKLEAMKKLEPPSDVTGIRLFLYLTGYYRSFYHNYSKLAEPLT